MIEFDLIGDKYSFEVDWNYFIADKISLDQEISQEELLMAFRDKLPGMDDL